MLRAQEKEADIALPNFNPKNEENNLAGDEAANGFLADFSYKIRKVTRDLY